MKLVIPGILAGVVRTGNNGPASLKIAENSVAQALHESPLTDEELRAIKYASCTGKTQLLVCGQKEYRVVADSTYMGLGPDQLPYIKEGGRLNQISPAAIRVALSEARTVAHGATLRRYLDAGVMYPDGCVTATVSCMDVVIEGVRRDVVQSIRGAGARQLRNGICRIGLPQKYFRKIFSAIWMLLPAVWRNIQQTPRYFWVEASWGSVNVPMDFTYRSGGDFTTLTDQLEVHDMLQGESVLGLCDMQLHVTSAAQLTNAAVVGIPETYEIGATLHRFVAQRLTSDRGLPIMTSATLHLTGSDTFSFNNLWPRMMTSADM
jgi:hypothetical protein